MINEKTLAQLENECPHLTWTATSTKDGTTYKGSDRRGEVVTITEHSAFVRLEIPGIRPADFLSVREATGWIV